MSWGPVTKAAPCIGCGKPDWCTRSEDGNAAHCMRTVEPPVGWRLQKRCDDGGVVFVEDNGHAPGRLASRNDHARSKTAATVDRTAEAECHAGALTAELADELGETLGLPAEVLSELGVGWCASRSSWTFPEVDPGGRVVGLVYRNRDGVKLAGRGHRRGLCVPRGLSTRPDPVLAVEGPTDVLACLAMGVTAVGRPSDKGDTEFLAELLADRDVLVLGEGDLKPDGKWPGRDGAITVAGQLARRWGRPVSWALPPEGVKDVRAWLNSQTVGPAEAGRRFVGLVREAAEPADPSPPYADAVESMAGLRTAARTSKDLRLGAMRLCDQVAEWFARRGPETLGKDYPIPYSAAALGVTRVHLYRLRDIGRVRLALRCNPVGYNLDDVADRALRPLAPLLDRSPDEIGPAWDMAQELADADAAEKAQRNGRQPPKRARVEARHVRQAIGQDRARVKIPRASTPSEIARRLAACFEAVTATPDVPVDVLRPLRTARDNARTWAKGGDR